jgi:hypothetical protein
MQHDLIHTDHGLHFLQRLSFMPNAAPQMRVDIHLGKLRQGRFIPGPVGKKFAGNFLLRNERCRRIQEKSLVQWGINPAHGS